MTTVNATPDVERGSLARLVRLIIEPNDSPQIDDLISGGYVIFVSRRNDGSYSVSRGHRNPRKHIPSVKTTGATLAEAIAAQRSAMK